MTRDVNKQPHSISKTLYLLKTPSAIKVQLLLIANSLPQSPLCLLWKSCMSWSYTSVILGSFWTSSHRIPESFSASEAFLASEITSVLVSDSSMPLTLDGLRAHNLPSRASHKSVSSREETTTESSFRLNSSVCLEWRLETTTLWHVSSNAYQNVRCCSHFDAR